MDYIIKTILVALLMLPFVLVFKLIKFILSRRRYSNDQEKTDNKTSRDWYGVCENCGKTDGLHRLNGKRYCAMCHARLKAEATQKDSESK